MQSALPFHYFWRNSRGADEGRFIVLRRCKSQQVHEGSCDVRQPSFFEVLLHLQSKLTMFNMAS